MESQHHNPYLFSFQLFSQLCFLALAPYLNPNRASGNSYTQFNEYGGHHHSGHGGGHQPHQQQVHHQGPNSVNIFDFQMLEIQQDCPLL